MAVANPSPATNEENTVIYPRVILKPGREKSVRNRHPWLFSGAIERIEGHAPNGEVADVTDASGAWLARGLLNRRSQITVRLFAWDAADAFTPEWLTERVAQADAWRRKTLPPDTDAYRVVFSESDGVPGLIVDRYGDVLVVQLSTLALQRRKEMVVDALRTALDPAAIVERVDVEAHAREGVMAAAGSDLLWGEASPVVEVHEHGLRFGVDLRGGQKTGFYLDQRENRQRVGAYCAGARVLNCFAYTGSFAVYAARAGAAQVINVDTAATALREAGENMARNGFARSQDEYVESDVFRMLREYRERGEQFDVIVLDPPKFASTAAQVPGATRGYKDINLLALQLLRPDGVLATFSCSGAVSADLFQKVVFGASVDARRSAQIVERLTQAPDHPVLLSFPEGEYLKGLLCRVV